MDHGLYPSDAHLTPGFTIAVITSVIPRQDSAHQHSIMDGRGAHEATPLSEELLEVNGW